jgi:hypothetical protein
MRSWLVLGGAAVAILVSSELVDAGQQRMVRVAIADDTERRRISDKAELWLRGAGSVWLQQKCNRLRNGSLACGPLDLGMRDVGQPLELYVYPDGRKLDAKGRETNQFKVPFRMTTDMCSQGCARDMITVVISDTTIEVDGAPIYAAGMKDGVKTKRR